MQTRSLRRRLHRGLYPHLHLLAEHQWASPPFACLVPPPRPDRKTHRPTRSPYVYMVSCFNCEEKWENDSPLRGICPSCREGGILHHCVGCGQRLLRGATDVACDECKGD
jgi:hypothetical protein